MENLTTEITADKIIDATFTFDLNDYSIWIDKEDFYVSVQVMSGFTGDFGFSAALFRTVFERTFYSNWEKISAGSPAINIDVKIEKEKQSEIVIFIIDIFRYIVIDVICNISLL
ncbi:hypothetical protein [Chryseobacterium sp. Marseille-Q3244]|uniref:hypothetical protein n=1 Tax=Chryseobacterium sp. Marseille-Q3244 TaxID=2758092 RepID=UPI002025A3BB|nr:hypothetical protein [Chryseobacterium sp. Marseille-Q3244]